MRRKAVLTFGCTHNTYWLHFILISLWIFTSFEAALKMFRVIIIFLCAVGMYFCCLGNEHWNNMSHRYQDILIWSQTVIAQTTGISSGSRLSSVSGGGSCSLSPDFDLQQFRKRKQVVKAHFWWLNRKWMLDHVWSDSSRLVSSTLEPNRHRKYALCVRLRLYPRSATNQHGGPQMGLMRFITCSCSFHHQCYRHSVLQTRSVPRRQCCSAIQCCK